MKTRFTKGLVNTASGALLVGSICVGLPARAQSDSPAQAQADTPAQTDTPAQRDGDRSNRGRRQTGPRDSDRRPRPDGMRDRGPARGPMPEGGVMMMMMLPVLAALDTDRDGEISAEEIAKASESLKTVDTNKDGKIDLQEMRPSTGRRPDQRAQMLKMRDGDRRLADRERGGRQVGFSDELLARLMRADKDQDGFLTEEELPTNLKRLFPKADTDGDKKLSGDEIKKAMLKRRLEAANRDPRGAKRAGAADRVSKRSEPDTPGGAIPVRPPRE